MPHKLPVPRKKTTFVRNAKELAMAAQEYFSWLQDNPIYKHQVTTYQGEVTLAKIPLPRVPTLNGLRRYAGISEDKWQVWRNDAESGLVEVIADIETTIHDTKFSGAAVDVFNSTFIARDLGLADRQDLSSSDGTMSPVNRIELVGPDDDSTD